jgi:hypothetical protein
MVNYVNLATFLKAEVLRNAPMIFPHPLPSPAPERAGEANSSYELFLVPPSWGRDLGRGILEYERLRIIFGSNCDKHEQTYMETRHDDISVTGSYGQLRVCT